MKPLITVIAIILFSIHIAFATTYYLSNDGNDSYQGTQADSAWKTITKLNSVTLQAVDSVLFRTGDIFRGQINLTESGSGSQSIYFGSYGNLNHPIISGAELISGWSSYSGNIYIASFQPTVSNFFVNGKMMTSARYPNSGFLTIDSSGINTGLYDAALTQSNNYWKGAMLKVRSSDNKYEQTQVDSFNAGWLKFETPINNNLSAGYGYYLDHIFSQLDTINEWYYDTSAHKIYFYSLTNPNSFKTEGSVYDYGINGINNNSYLKFNGIDFEKQAKDGAIFNGSNSNVRFQNCGFAQCMMQGLNFSSSSNDTIDHCNFININGLGVGNAFTQSLITDCHFKNIGTIPGYGLDGGTEYDAIRTGADHTTIISNSIDSVGFMGFLFVGRNNLIEKNLINHSMLLLNGGSGIYTYGTDFSKTIIKDNFVFNTLGNNVATPGNNKNAEGIRINNSSEITIDHNTIVNTATDGILVDGKNYDHTITNNVIYNSQGSQIYFLDPDTIKETHGNKVTGNIFYSLNDAEHPLTIDGKDSLFHPGLFNQNYYCNPYDFYPIYQHYIKGGEFLTKPYLIETWKNKFGGDNASHVSLVKWNTYSVTDTSGTDLIDNGNFTNNFDNWRTVPTTNNQMLLDNAVGLDGGCIKFKMVADTPQVWGQLVSFHFNYLPNQLYQFSFTGKSTAKNNAHASIRGEFAPFQDLDKFFPTDTSRADYCHVYKSKGGADALLIFELRLPDTIIWLDNIHLFTVNATYSDSSKLSKLITNYSPNNINVSLGDSIYRDLDGNVVKGSYNLPPFSSYVLTLDSPLFESTNKVIPNKSDLALFPNPINPSGQSLNYYCNTIENKKTYLQLMDLFGRIIFVKELSNNSGEIKIPSQVPAGFYLVKVFNEQVNFEQKLLIVR